MFKLYNSNLISFFIDENYSIEHKDFDYQFGLNFWLSFINLTISLIAVLCLFFSGFFISSLIVFLFYSSSIFINRRNSFCNFFFTFTNIYYFQRIIILSFFPSEFWYNKGLFAQSSFLKATIYCSILFGITGHILKMISFIFPMPLKKTLDILEIKTLAMLIFIFLLSNTIISLSGDMIIGYVLPTYLRLPVRILQMALPLSFLIFSPFFTRRLQFVFVFLMVLTAYFSGSKAIFFNILISLLICKLVFSNEKTGMLLIIFFITLATAPIMFLTANYIRYPHDVGNLSLFEYIFRDFSFSIFSQVSHRFAYFDTLLGFITLENLNHFRIPQNDYINETIAFLNRFFPGNIVELSHFFMPFEEKSAFELRGTIISQFIGIGRHTESMALVNYYFIDNYLGSLIFILLVVSSFLLFFLDNIIIKTSAFLYIIEVLSGGDIQSKLVLPLNFLLLYVIFKAIVYFLRIINIR